MPSTWSAADGTLSHLLMALDTPGDTDKVQNITTYCNSVTIKKSFVPIKKPSRISISKPFIELYVGYKIRKQKKQVIEQENK